MSSNAQSESHNGSSDSSDEQQRRRRRRGRSRQRSSDTRANPHGTDSSETPANTTEARQGAAPSQTLGKPVQRNDRPGSNRDGSNRDGRNRRGRGPRNETPPAEPNSDAADSPNDVQRRPQPSESSTSRPDQDRQDKRREKSKKKREKPDIAAQPGSLQRRMVRIDGPREDLLVEPYIPVIEPVKAANVNEYIAAHKGWQKEVMTKLHALVKSTCPQAVESIKWSQPVFEYEGFLCYIKAFGNHVNLGFWRGTELSDPESLLTGDGLKLRHVKISSASDFNAPALAELIKHAMRLNHEKGDPTQS